MRPSAACRVLPPALLHRLIVLAGALTPIGRLGVPVALEKEAEAVVQLLISRLGLRKNPRGLVFLTQSQDARQLMLKS